MRILILGAGMYVTGRNGTGTGTILGSLCEASRELPISSVVVAARKEANGAIVADVAANLNVRLGTSLQVDYMAVPDEVEAAVAAAVERAAPDCAIVSLPDHLHYAYADALMARGIHCLMVKPFTPTLAEGQALVRRQKEMNLYCAVEFHKRWDEQNLLAHRLIASGELGRVLYGVVQYSQRIDIPRNTFSSWASQTNIFQYLGVHYVDLFHFLTRSRPVRANAVATRGLLAGMGIDTPDSVHATILWLSEDGRNEIVTQFATNWIDPSTTTALSDQQYSLVGSVGRLELEQKNRGVMLTTPDGVRHINPYFAEFLSDGAGGERYSGYGPRSVIQYLRDVEAVRLGRVSAADLEGTRPTFRDALVSTSVIDAVNRSLANSGSWEDIPNAFA